METVPYFILAGRVNYARYAPVYVPEMKQLRDSHAAAFDHMMNGGFVVRRSSKSTF